MTMGRSWYDMIGGGTLNIGVVVGLLACGGGSSSTASPAQAPTTIAVAAAATASAIIQQANATASAISAQLPTALATAPLPSPTPKPPTATLPLEPPTPTPTPESPTPTSTPSPTSSPTPTPSPTPSPTPAATPILCCGQVLYQADWSTGLNGWVSGASWDVVQGTLVTDGPTESAEDNWIKAPFQPPTADYAIEAEIQILNPGRCFVSYFGIIARVDDAKGGGITAGWVDCDGTLQIAAGGYSLSNPIAEQGFSRDQMGTSWHLYRLEVQGNAIRLFIDGQAQPVLEAQDNRFLAAGEVGLFTYYAQISVRSFKVIAL